MRMRCTSPRMTTFIQTLLSAPMCDVADHLRADGPRTPTGATVDGRALSVRSMCSRVIAESRRHAPESTAPRSSAASAPAASGTCPSCRRTRPRTPRRSGRTAPARCPRWRRSSPGSGVVFEISSVTKPFPLGLERRDVDDEAAARVGGLADAHRQHVARDAEVLDRLAPARTSSAG